MKVFGCASYVYVDPDARDKLDAKARKSYLISFDSNYIRYRLWDDQNRKIIRHKDITFDEIKLYKDRLAVESDNTGENSQRHEEAVLEDISEKDIASKVQGNPEHLDEDPEQVTPPLKIRRKTRVSRPIQRYSPSLYY